MKFKKRGRLSAFLIALCLICSTAVLQVSAQEYDETSFTLTGNGSADIIGVALTQAGYAEGDGGYTKYGEYFGDADMDWCCAFVSWCAVNARINAAVIPRNCSCTSMKNDFALKDRYYISAHFGGSYTPTVGDLIFISYTYTLDEISHIGIVTKVSDGKVYTVEGNYSNRVADNLAYSLNSAKVVGYAHPDYSTEFQTYYLGKYLIGDTMNFRESPSTDGKKLGQIPANSVVTVAEISGDWGKTVYNGKTGWINLQWSTYIDESSAGDGTDWLMVDISQWNAAKNFDWNALANGGVKAVIIRIGGRYYGSTKALYNDDAFYDNYVNAKKAGLHVGVYFFSYALDADGAKEEADRTIELLQQYNCELDMPVFIDIEDAGPASAIDRQHSKAGKQVCTTVVNTFCSTIEDAGYYAGVYCSLSFAKDLLDYSVFTGRATWIAHYSSQCGFPGKYDMWQFTDCGKVEGYNGTIDLNYCYTDFPALIEKMKSGESSVYGTHIPSDWTVVKEPTCYSEGEAQIICNDCQKVLCSRTIEKTAHTDSATKYYTADTSLTVGGNAQSVSFAQADDWQISLQQAGVVFTCCPSCQTVLSAQYVYDDCTHWENTFSLNEGVSTCTQAGVTESICAQCNRVSVATLLNFAEHTPGSCVFSGTDCTQEGANVTQCANCQQAMLSVYVQPREHRYDSWVTEKAVSCVQDGVYSSVCTVCKQPCVRAYEPPKYGDGDLDGTVSASDARLALRTAVGIEWPNQAQLAAMDTDLSGTCDASDARLILRIAVNLEDADALFVKYYGDDANAFIVTAP